ncbi:hypothetical protein LXL04_031711 [Taraxacum kok-saghyz]
MNVYGGDSWGREAQHRKRRVADLLLDAAGDHSSYRKLPSGKYVCLVCPHTPVIDTPLMLSLLHHGNPEQSAASNRCAMAESTPYDSTSIEIKASGKDVVQLPLDYREQREKELKFISAGWKRDCHGGWFRDENVIRVLCPCE